MTAASPLPAPAHPSALTRGSGTRTALIVGPILTAIGIAWTAIDSGNASSAAVLVGLVTCIVGTHRFGRMGPEPSVELAEKPAEKIDGANEPSDPGEPSDAP